LCFWLYRPNVSGNLDSPRKNEEEIVGVIVMGAAARSGGV
jgi:hypothetical protein